MTTIAVPLLPAPRRRELPPAAAPVCVSTRAITKRFPVHRGLGEVLRHPLTRPTASVLRDVTLDVHQGELFGVLGLNGAGKTTLLRILAGLLHADGGTAIVDGVDVAAAPFALRERLALVTADERSLHWRLSAWENMRLYAGLHRMPVRLAKVRIAEALTAVALADTGQKLVGTMSSGMRQRLLVARALLARPRVLLLDEPTRSLDPLSAHAFREMLREVVLGARGATVILATHSTEEAFAHCDRVAILHRGAVAALGTADALAARYVAERYQAWTNAPEHPALAALAADGLIGNLAPDRLQGLVAFDVPGGEGGAAAVLRALIEAGVSVSRFERLPVGLSALIGRIATDHDAARMRPEGPHA